jgi:hypothetical protein
MVFVAVSMVLTGCAGMKPERSAANVTDRHPDSEEINWWFIRFQNQWPEGGTAEWYLDALIAHRVIAPVYDKYKDRISLWRFHRRAARDAAGHQFSFIFYADAVTATEVIHAVRRDSLLAELQRAGIIKQVLADDTRQSTRTSIGDTSDQRWSTIVKNTWPYFIMGVSKTWLEMIDSEVGRRGLSFDNTSIVDLQNQYRSIDDDVRHAWQSEGHHAFLHHLNAVFGYTPVMVGEDRLMKF